MNRILFYPCCGADIANAINAFHPQVDCVHGADIRSDSLGHLRACLGFVESTRTKHAFEVECTTPSIHAARNAPHVTTPPFGELIEGCITVRRGRTLELTFHRYDAVEALNQLNRIDVFFFRRDCPREGEGSSGLPFLGDTLFSRVVHRLSKNGLIVTDGAHMSGGGTQAALWTAPHEQAPVGQYFTAFGRSFVCERALISDRTPTLVWRAD